jgi:two-component system heavy metal sensor histidine kinase CusS
MRRWSLAGRLTAAYVIVAFALLAGAMFVQYQTLDRDLAAEDDQLLLDRLVADRPATERPAARANISGEAGPYVRLLDEHCHVVRAEYSGIAPPPRCDTVAGAGPVFRSWRAPDGHVWRVAAQPSPTGWIEEMLDRELDVSVVRQYRQRLSGVLAVTLAILAVVGLMIARRGLAPLNTLAARMSRVTAESLDQRLGATDVPAEIRPLTSSFDRMLERLEGAFRTLSESSADLAHELRTPIHVLRQQAEVALSRARTPDEYREVLRSMLEDLDRLRRMIDDMLFLARAEDPRQRIERVDHAVGEELTAVAEFLDALAAEGGVTITTDASPSLVLRGDRMLLRRALVNVVTNALRHTPRGGRITLTGRGEPGAIVIEVHDTGSGIAPEVLPRIFDRHVRVPPPNGSAPEGSGLGLSIVRSIIHLHGGTAEASSASGAGTRVTLRFPDR